MIKTVFSMLGRTLSDKCFPLCCFVVFALSFTANAGASANGDPTNVLSYIFGSERNPPAADFILNLRGGSWMFMFLPMISGLCFVNVLCDDKVARFLRYEIFRIGYFKFKAAKYISCVLSSGICTLIGYSAFTVFVKLYFSNEGDHIQLNFAAMFAEIFVLGVISAVPAIVTVSFTNNKYLIVCVPFLLKYCMSGLSQKLSDMAYADYEHPNFALAQIGMIVNYDSVVYAFSYSGYGGVILANAVILFGGFAVYLFRKGGADKGE